MEERIRAFLARKKIDPSSLERLKGDASTRSYYRVAGRGGGSAVLMIHAAPGDPAEEAYCNMTGFFLGIGVPVPEILDRDPALGILLLQDLGTISLRVHLECCAPTERWKALNDAAALIARIQNEGTPALSPAIAAFHTRFDEETFLKELTLFHTSFFSTLAASSPSPAEEERIRRWYEAAARELASFSLVLCHRDYHIDNIFMHDARLCLIDFQDARIGPSAYDLCSLTKDRDIDAFMDEAMSERIYQRFLALTGEDRDRFKHQFNLATAQRCLKAVGTFSRMVSLGRKEYLPFVPPTLRRVRTLLEGRHALPGGWESLLPHLHTRG